MKAKQLILTFLLGVASIFTYTIYGQTGSPDTRENAQPAANEEVKQQKADDKDRIDDARIAKKQTQTEAKRTKQINKDAMDASRESKKAYRDEKKAQKSRKTATKQAEKASDARKKSVSNE